MPMKRNNGFALLLLKPLLNPAFHLSLAMCFLMLGSSTRAQEHRVITFEAPGADTTVGDDNGTYPTGINNLGAVTGAYQDTNSNYHGFLRRPDGTFITFEAPGADTGAFNGTSAFSINDLGVITGYYSDASGLAHGFLRSADGKFTSFDAPGVGGYGTFPLAINLEGAVVGYYTDSNYTFHSFLRKPDGKFVTFDGPGQCEGNGSQGCYGSEDSNINFFGLSAGNYMDNSPNMVQHGLIRHPDGTLSTFDVPGAGTNTNQGTGCPGCALGLNQRGVIAGIYSDANTVNHGYVRSPDGKFTTYDAPGAGTASFQGTGCYSDCPVSINDWGAIAGVYIDANNVYHGYLRSPEGKIVTIDPKGSVFTAPVGINDAGVIAGEYADANNVFHGFIIIPNSW
jgi:hypothetical protein